MVVTLNRTPNACHIRVQYNPPGGAPPLILNLDMSLQRHCYRNLEQAQAKPANSVLLNSVSDQDIDTDLRGLGQQVETRMAGGGQPFRPTLAEQLAGVRRGMDAGTGITGSVNAMEAAIPTTVFGDYVVASGRTYRVDNTAINFLAPANHCYPIAGPGLWGNIDLTTFAGIVSFRRLELALAGKRGTPWENWERLSRDPGGRYNPLHGHFTGAATNFGRLPQPTRQKIIQAAGNSRFHNDIGDALGRIEAERH
ncbi:hypothetical protein EU803_10680 [Loktanella sp. IMCC34160]|uniref:hypothetical protein n=1 Tax=Loktanella sp. IMCC34160 TaxID=2510646 RepID=UPI00101DD16B|nr:hypothetical protein [Loktanella sp. IMCC34160]RYG91544.1 hypothetical protein EU803_10680 [Loktanella sp. IMCC34160]